MAQPNAQKITDDINTALGVEEKQVITSAMPGCDDLFYVSDRGGSRSTVNFGDGGKGSSYRLQYASVDF